MLSTGVFIFQLFPFQIHAVEWLKSKSRAILALEMGLGKTVVAITAAKELNLKNILVLCPAIAVPHWRTEIKRFYPEVTPHVFSYASLHKIPPIDNLDLLILDESHFLKSPEAHRTQAILGKKRAGTALPCKLKRIWGLSGTPAPNHAGELWTLVFTFGATKLNYTAWLDKFCNIKTLKIGHRVIRQITGTKISAIPELQEILKPVMLKKTKEEVMLELPPLFFQTITVPANFVDIKANITWTQEYFPINGKDESHRFWAKLAFERDMMEKIITEVEQEQSSSEGGHKFQEIGTYEALGRATRNFYRYTGLQKLDAIAELVSSELDNNAYKKLVIFCVHRDVVVGLQERLAKYKPLTIYGMTPQDKRQSNLERFKKDADNKILICNIMAAGTAITLTNAHQVLFAEMSYVPGDNAQAMMRCHRIGQKNPVTVRFVALEDSIDQKIVRVLQRKTQELTKIFDWAKPDGEPEILPPKFKAQVMGNVFTVDKTKK